ncbi:MAG: septal ring lytic transglycosylase RlpA family protein [Solirubrobacteraceae bacterium]
MATIMLAVPSCAFALSGSVTDTTAAASGTPLQAAVTPRRSQLGHAVTVTGVAPAADAGRWAMLETAPGKGGGWRVLRSTRIASGGHFRLRTRLRRSGYVRVIDVATAASPSSVSSSLSAANPAAGTSPPLPVTVAAQLSVPRRSLNALGGTPVVVRGRLMPARAGRWVRLQGHFANGWRTLARGRTGSAGGFGLRYIAASGLKRRLRVGFAGDRLNARSVQPAGQLTVYSQSLASWYDDAGNTACGFHAGLGVANRSLPCGTKVRLRYGGRSVTATVDDRGPYVGGRDWDLNQNTAAALGFGGVGTVWVNQ